MSLFQKGQFKSHSGLNLRWKVDADWVQESDWDCMAMLIASQIQFREVVGVPRGGIPFAKALMPFAKSTSRRILIVDDVLTTGQSMEEMKEALGDAGKRALGIVLFSRCENIPDWIIPIWQLNTALVE